MLRQWVKSKAAFEINDLKPAVWAGKCEGIPAIFLHAKSESSEQLSISQASHTQEIFDKYTGEPKVFYQDFEGDDWTPRPHSINAKCADFAVDCTKRKVFIVKQ